VWYKAEHEVNMTREVELSCRCGAVHGVVTGVAPSSVNRIVCYCADCQAYTHQLHRADLLDAHGGSDIVQVAPATIRIDRGRDQISGLRLSDKGLFRFYASCCNTPLGNTVGPVLPFVGVLRQAFVVDALGGADAVLGPPRAGVYGKDALGTPPEGSTKFNLLLIVRLVASMLRWRLRGLGLPNPFFDTATRKPHFPVVVLSLGERDSLRPLCGPRAV
jgi:hypothetical protein